MRLSRAFRQVSVSRTLCGVLLTFLLCASAEAASETKTAPGPRVVKPTTQKLEDKWGIKVESVRLSAGGHMIDFRYRVLDPAKAAALGDPEAKAYLVDRATGAKLNVPRSPKVGPLRQSAESLTAGKVYFAMFSNAGRAVKPGSKVTIVVGNFKAENLVVQ